MQARANDDADTHHHFTSPLTGAIRNPSSSYLLAAVTFIQKLNMGVNLSVSVLMYVWSQQSDVRPPPTPQLKKIIQNCHILVRSTTLPTGLSLYQQSV